MDCPECGCEIPLAVDSEEGEIIVCPDCEVELEIVTVDPFVVDYAPEEKEDWGE
ncbi:lysine biosynthesis protein LysW [Candidatus Altiarchaeota archaeon]